ncbi:MAG: hypothetical protein ABSC47_10500 [Terracidiphilus sp.]
MKIPKFEDETDEANWLYEHREELAAEFMQAAQEGRVHRGTLKRGMRLEAVLHDALQSKELVVTPEELTGSSLVAVLREKLAKS